MKKKNVDTKTSKVDEVIKFLTKKIRKKESNNSNRSNSKNPLSKSSPKTKRNNSEYLVQSQEILNQQSIVLTKMEEIANKLSSPNPSMKQENVDDKDRLNDSIIDMTKV